MKTKQLEDPREWLSRQFEFENCCECGRGARSHDVCLVLGNYFAKCKPVRHRPIVTIHDPRFPKMPHFANLP